jgi:hypothetical protein
MMKSNLEVVENLPLVEKKNHVPHRASVGVTSNLEVVEKLPLVEKKNHVPH